jgi:hypothetical protein
MMLILPNKEKTMYSKAPKESPLFQNIKQHELLTQANLPLLGHLFQKEYSYVQNSLNEILTLCNNCQEGPVTVTQQTFENLLDSLENQHCTIHDHDSFTEEFLQMCAKVGVLNQLDFNHIEDYLQQVEALSATTEYETENDLLAALKPPLIPTRPTMAPLHDAACTLYGKQDKPTADSPDNIDAASDGYSST